MNTNDYHHQAYTGEKTRLGPVYRGTRSVSEPLPRKTPVLMVGMHLTKTRGGISTLTRDILHSSLTGEYDFIYVASQAEDYGRIRKAVLAVTSFLRFTILCIAKRPALVYVHIGSNASLYRESAFIVLARLLGKSVLSHFHAGDVDDYYPQQPELGKSFIRRAIGMSETVIAVSQASASQLRNIVPTANIAVIPNAVDMTSFVPRPEIAIAESSPVRLLFVGATGKLKGEHDLIEAIALARKSEPNFKSSLIGFGAEGLRAKCALLGIAEVIEYLGPVSVDERISFFQNADIFVLPTYAEAMPVSVIEAMASGLAIITTPVGGIPELIEDGVDGFLVEPGDVKALAERIVYLVRNPEVRRKTGRNANRKFKGLMKFSNYIDKLRNQMKKVETAGTIS